MIILQSLGIWWVLAIAAVLNGFLRVGFWSPLFGADIALPLSGILMSLFILLISWWLVPLLKQHNGLILLAIGTFWVGLTLLFEYAIGYWLIERHWLEMLPLFDVQSGNLYSLVILVAWLAPWAVMRIQETLHPNTTPSDNDS